MNILGSGRHENMRATRKICGRHEHLSLCRQAPVTRCRRVQILHMNQGWCTKHVSCVSDHIDAGNYVMYPDAARLVAEAADKMNITNKTVLVIGTEVPWIETILLQRKPRSSECFFSFVSTCIYRKGVTVEYAQMKR